jgi:hypothetical protein
LFLSVDIYTCKSFRTEVAVDFTRSFFECREISHREF